MDGDIYEDFAVGAPYETDKSGNVGAVFIYRGSENFWTSDKHGENGIEQRYIDLIINSILVQIERVCF